MWVVIEHAGRRLRVAVARSAQGVWVGVPGDPRLVASAGRRARGGAAAPDTGEVRAPMTARVVAVRAAVGDAVEKGAPLVALEAMQMEYRLDAPRAGTVAAVHCKTGELVDLGALLVTLAP